MVTFRLPKRPRLCNIGVTGERVGKTLSCFGNNETLREKGREC